MRSDRPVVVQSLSNEPRAVLRRRVLVFALPALVAAIDVDGVLFASDWGTELGCASARSRREVGLRIGHPFCQGLPIPATGESRYYRWHMDEQPDHSRGVPETAVQFRSS